MTIIQNAYTFLKLLFELYYTFMTIFFSFFFATVHAFEYVCFITFICEDYRTDRRTIARAPSTTVRVNPPSFIVHISLCIKYSGPFILSPWQMIHKPAMIHQKLRFSYRCSTVSRYRIFLFFSFFFFTVHCVPGNGITVYVV